MSKSKRRQKAICWNKVRYLKLNEAVFRASIDTKKYGTQHYVYRCDICDKYHLTTHPGKDVKAIDNIYQKEKDEVIELTEDDFIEVIEIEKDNE